VQVILTVRGDIARALNSTQSRQGIGKEIWDVAKDFGVTIQQLHPATADPELSRYFVVERIDPSTAHRMIARLRSLPAVESVYVKAPGEPP
jgi:hypothetical protein